MSPNFIVWHVKHCICLLLPPQRLCFVVAVCVSVRLYAKYLKSYEMDYGEIIVGEGRDPRNNRLDFGDDPVRF